MKINGKLLEEMIEQKMVWAHPHPTLPITLYDYSKACTYDKVWNEVTLLCRGLILENETYKIVSLPLPKFFNYEEHGVGSEFIKQFEKDGFIATEKADGSLGILWEYDGHRGVSTRGSWASDQAIWATTLINEPKYWDIVKNLDTDNYTYVFEIVYDTNRIVLKYDFENLVALAKINKNTGKDIPYLQFIDELYPTFNRVKVHPELSKMTMDEIKALDLKGIEGHVLQNLITGQRLKVKQPDYVRLHSIITNITYRDIWKTLKTDGDLTEVYEEVPDEFYDWVKEKVKALQTAYDGIKAMATLQHAHVKFNLEFDYSKKDFAMEVKKIVPDTYTGLVFAIENKQDISDTIWRRIYPGHEKPFN